MHKGAIVQLTVGSAAAIAAATALLVGADALALNSNVFVTAGPDVVKAPVRIGNARVNRTAHEMVRR